MRLRACAVALLVSALALPAAAASLFDPALRFRTLATEHFIIYFHQGQERTARRLGPIAEETWRTLQRPLGVTPPRRTHVVLADQTELANGYATPLPYDTIVIFPVWPSPSDFEFDDWLRLSFTHEFTHIVHLDRSEQWAHAVRAIFGRTPFAFPNVFLPAWQIEGLATYEESAITGTGRLHAGDFRAVVAEDARARTLQPLDRVNGGLTDWPDGIGVYAYGVGFHEYLADRFGAETLATLAAATARRVPYLASGAFKRVYGQSLGALWREYEASLTEAITATVPDTTPPTRLTHHGFSVRGPRFDRAACEECAPDILYSASNANGFPALYRVAAHGGTPRHVTTRYLGSTTAIGRDDLYFDQLEITRNTGLYSDLYAFSRSTGRVRRLTRGMRLIDPDLSPDGTTIVAAQDRGGQRDLVTVRLPVGHGRRSGATDRIDASLITPVIAEVDTYFNTPRWSPDGRSIAVARHRLGAMPEIVVVDVEQRAVRVIAADPETRFTMPAWRPDGRAVVAAAAPKDETFNLVEVAADGTTRRQLTHTSGGATWPDVSPDGATIVFAGYTSEGYDIFTVPYAPAQPSAQVVHGANQLTQPTDTRSRNQTQAAATAETVTATAAYWPLRTLKPTSWAPIVETDGDQVRVGAATGGVDVLGYHAYYASASWLVAGPSGTIAPPRASPDWQLYYTYDRWRPRPFVSASIQTSFFDGPPSGLGTPTATTVRERQVEAGVSLPIVHTRVRHAALLSLVRTDAEFTLAAGTETRRRTAARAAWETVTARTYGYSISREQGMAAGATVELVRSGRGAFAEGRIVSGDVRTYLPGLASHHVIAVRASGATSNGNPLAARTFVLGGDSVAEAVVDFDGDAFSLLRGFAPNTFAGTHVALVNAEYRWPIARPQRGVGTWPVFLHSIHAAVFADAGHTWTGQFRSRAIKTSAGAQLSADIVAGYFAPFTITGGIAFGHDGSGLIDDRITAYFHVGRSF
jgi:hypothetical protein